MAKPKHVAYNHMMNDAFDLNELARRYLDLWQQHLLQTAKDPDLTADLATIMEVMPSLFFSAIQQRTGSKD